MGNEVLYKVVLPIILTQLGSVLLFYLGLRERKPKQRVDMLDTMEDISSGLVEQLKGARREARTNREGALVLVAQLEDAGITPKWRPNGNE